MVAACPAIVADIVARASLAIIVRVTISPTFALVVSVLFDAIVTVESVAVVISRESV